MNIRLPKLGWLKNKKILLAIALVVLVLIAFGAYRVFRPDVPAPPSESAIVTHSTDTPDETKPDKGYEWKGAANDPKYIRLPTIQTEGFIQNVGIDQNKEVAVPNNIHFAGWFADSVRPGHGGLSIIDGHVDGRAEAGIFKRLADLKAGAEYSVEMGNGSVKRYRVKEVVTLDTKEAVNALFSQNLKVKSQLNLITCGGTFDQQSQQYDKRVIAVSELIN